MLTSIPQGADASTGSAIKPPVTVAAGDSPKPLAGQSALPPFDDDDAFDDGGERVRHMLFSTPRTVARTIQHLHKLRYAEVNDWSRPISTGRAGEVMAILTKRIGAE